MNENEVVLFSLLLLLAFVIMMLAGLLSRALRRVPPLRVISGYTAMPAAVDASVEQARPVHVSPGSVRIGQESTLSALASLAIIYNLVERQAFMDHMPLATVSDPVMLVTVQDALRKAYIERNNRSTYRSNATVWFPQTERSLAFGAGAAGFASDVRAYANILMGQFGSELAYIGETSARHNQIFIGHSTQLEGQAIAYAQSDALLIGEELFVGEAYLNPDKSLDVGGVVALDVLRWVAVAAIILIALNQGAS
ncbi:MAG: hypothetical protein L0154_00650 [Chloroflexi bacterium]|nr:hypothetical protein [Chloroflexota bacterium]